MIRILSSFAIIVAAAAVIAGGTYSHFDKQKSQANNTVAMGTVNIDIENGEDQGELPFKFEDMVPGDTVEALLNVTNTGTLPAVISGDVSGAWTFDGSDNFVTVEKVQYKNANGNWKTATSLEDLPVLDPEAILEIKIIAKIDFDMTNDYQGKIYKASFNVTATQADNLDQM